MLERTVACLEPCGRRILPPRRNPLRSARQQLHTSFWHHGAAEVELTSAWHALMHGTHDTGPLWADHAHAASHDASAFLLDFLYPTGALALMRRLSPIAPAPPGRLRLGVRPSHVSPRLYNSSFPRQPPGSDSSTVRDPTDPVPGNRNATRGRVLASSIAIGDQEPPTAQPKPPPHLAMEDILAENDPSQAHLLWDHYKSLDDHSQLAYLGRLLAFLSKTGRVDDSLKASELFHKLEESQWDGDTFLAGVTVEINLQNFSRGLSIFKRGLRSPVLDIDNTALAGALDLLLASAFASSTTDLLEQVWSLYPDLAARWDFNDSDFNDIIASLHHSATVPNLAEKALIFPEYMKQRLEDPSCEEADREALRVLQKLLVRKALVHCEEAQVVPLLMMTKDPSAFEEYIRTANKKGNRRLLPKVYAIYRTLPGCSPSHAVLHCVFNAYLNMMGSSNVVKLSGIERLLEDWRAFNPVPSRRAYQRHMAFHASLGNKERVHSLWIEYVQQFREDPDVKLFDGEEGSDTFAHLLHVHAVNAEPERAQQIFTQMRTQFKIEPSLYHWNILLNAYARSGDYEMTIETFESLCNTLEPDRYSYGTLMQMVGSRGDLSFAVDLYRGARKGGVDVNGAMLSSLVDAYCQNDLFREAEDVCMRAASKGIIETRMWNKLLHYNALRRDLAGTNRVLNAMAEKGIPYNGFTYEQLLLALALCKQSQHAVHLLTVALKENVFQVTPTHFQIVMGALLRTGEPALVRTLCRLMNENKIPITEQVVFRLSQALGQWKNLPARQRGLQDKKRWLANALRTFFRIYGHRVGTNIRAKAPSSSDLSSSDLSSLDPTQPRGLLRSGQDIYRFSSMMTLFAQLNESGLVTELVDLYRHVFRSTSNDEGILPVPMLNAVMLSGLQDQRFDRVKSTWQLLFRTAVSEARSADYKPTRPHSSKISPRYRYSLSGGLRVMQELLFQEGDASGLRKLVEEVLDAGFEVDSKNWNYHVQALAQMRRPKEAFEVCEKVLMPNWTGWNTARSQDVSAMRPLPLDTRRKGLSPRYLRPTATTLYQLARAYLALTKQGFLSGDAAATLHVIESRCVQAVRAIKSMMRVYSNLEDEIFGLAEGTDSLEPEDELRPEDGLEQEGIGSIAAAAEKES